MKGYIFNDNKDRADFLDSVYPVGSVYISTSATHPSELFGGSWQELPEGRVLLAQGTSYPAGSTGGEATHTLTKDEIPSHTHERGTMNITGTIPSENRSVDVGSAYSGAFYRSTSNTQNYFGMNGHDKDNPRAYFDASRSWTGETSSIGGDKSHNNMQPYLSVYMWTRTA